MNIATIMDYPDLDKFNLMCMIWMKRVQQHAPGSRVIVLTAKGLSSPLRRYFGEFDNVEIRPADRRNLGEYDHFNLAVKLHNLARMEEPFLFLDADMFVISDLSYLWERRLDKPWIGVDDQTSQLGISAPFAHLNSGMQLVSDPSFYDYSAIAACFEKHGRHFICNGEDQALLFDYFRTIGYDYKHPEINSGWNSCSQYTELYRNGDGEWRGVTRNFPEKYPVHIVHYWNGSSRPWHVNCPLFAEEAGRLVAEGRLEKGSVSATIPRPAASNPPARSLKVCVLNAPPEVVEREGEHPFAPLKNWAVETVADSDEADMLSWHLPRRNPKAAYDELVYKNSRIFRENESRFLLFTSMFRPGILYLNNAIGLTPHPVYSREINRLSNVLSVPFMFDCGMTASMCQDDFANDCRGLKKNFDLCFPIQAEGLVRSGLANGGSLRLRPNEVGRAQVEAAAAADREKLLTDAIMAVAASRFYLHVETIAEAPLLLYHALMAGTVPIIVGLPDLPFGDLADWREFAMFPSPGKSLDDLVREGMRDYGSKRQNAMSFWSERCRPAECNDRILEICASMIPGRNG